MVSLSTNREYSLIFCKIYEDFWQILKIFGSTKNVRTNRILFVRTKIIFDPTKKSSLEQKNIRTNKKIFGRNFFIRMKILKKLPLKQVTEEWLNQNYQFYSVN